MNRLKRLISLYQRISDPDTIFIYQMGKVGSTSLEHSIKKAFHVHAFYSDNHTCLIRQQGLAGIGIRYFFKRAMQELEYFVMRLAFRRRAKVKIITLVREPMKRNISMFFHDLDSYLFAYYTGFTHKHALPKTTREQNVDVLKQCFLDVFPHEYPLTWFDNEFYRMTNVDIFNYPYDKQKGLGVIKTQQCDVVVLDINKLSDNTDAIERLTSQKIELGCTNVGDKKWYADLYKDFDDQDERIRSLKARFSQSKYYKHFY